MEKLIRATKKDNSYRKYKGGGPRPDLKSFKQQEAKERQEMWSKLSAQEKLNDLDRRLGKGKGAKKQRARILASMKEQPKKK